MSAVAALELFNTLSGKVERLEPVGAPALRMYACGPTIYDYGHIGNFRTFLHVDVLRRFLRQQGVAVEHVMNVTDVDDKIIRNALAAKKPIAEYTARFERAFFEDMEALGIERPEHVPRATEHIPEMVGLIERLAAKDIAYQTEDGSWYFRIERFPEYGKLSKHESEGMAAWRAGRLGQYAKEEVRDFVLWKAAKARRAELGDGLGPGRPGWHIECSAMARECWARASTFTAAARTSCSRTTRTRLRSRSRRTGKTFARLWIHVRFLLVEGEKMSKSLGNFYTLRDLILKGHKPSSLRFSADLGALPQADSTLLLTG